ncbi:F-actin-monooxygenase MICAL2 isoform X5 [Megalops cyprinoides]|uniref:F-actin-monooxygenase MICAL2 isoform X5 n=1 Tax=Megalops cyprinoides TaxID=118141 RepID=UPI001863F75A|nr:F-actin-monooxygenase MICAL2 isoform X5 [Megalops cyprinoides]
MMGETEDERSAQAGQLFENFIQASTCKGTLQAFSILCRQLELDPRDNRSFYGGLKARVTSWKAKALWSKLDKRATHKEYKKGRACVGTKCLIIGGGPCGLRTAIELALLGAKVVVIEKRDTFSRNNVLHLWPYTIHDLRGLGAKKFYGKFCAGSIDHISIRQLQLMLLKIALIVAVEVHVGVEFVKLLEPPEDQENEGPGWRAELRPADHPISEFDFDVIVGADGRRSTLEGFRRKEFRGKLAIAITANFINRNTTAEAKVEEISGVAFIFNQKFFLDLKDETGIDLENIVYYKDNTHYFVMTAKKQSLLDKGVIIHDYIDTEKLLSSENVNQEALLSYAREAADFGTHYQLPSLDFAMNHNGQPDVAMFDFTCMYASENAALVRERFGHQLLVALVGDSLLEPFWPMGTGCARGFLAAFDTAWMVRSWAQGRPPLEILAERESLYRLLPQTTPENITKNFEQYTIDPGTRYPNLNSNCVRPHQVRHLYITGELQPCSLAPAGSVRRSVNFSQRGSNPADSEIRPNRLLGWCQRQTEGYRNVNVSDLTTSWKSGLALCALIHRFRPDLIDFDSLKEEDAAGNSQLALEIAERELGISPAVTWKEMTANEGPDKLCMTTYLSKFYEMFRGTPTTGPRRQVDENNEDYFTKSANYIYNLMNAALPRKRVPKDDKKFEDNDSTSKRRRRANSYLEEATNFTSQSASSGGMGGEVKENKVRSMATQLLAKFEDNTPNCMLRRKTERPTPVPVSSVPKCTWARSVPESSASSHFPSHASSSCSQERKCNGPAYAVFHKQTESCDSKQTQSLHPLAQRTVGKVSSVISAKAETLVTLYENDHRPKAAGSSLSPGGSRKEFPQNLGGSDTCHFCEKRVYVMERLGAEGCFFHRDCFRCHVCGSALRLGGHAFDSEEGKFYCKAHFAQHKASVKHKRRTGDLQKDGRGAGTRVGYRRSSPDGTVPQSCPPGTLSSFLRQRLRWPVRVTRAAWDAPRRLSRWARRVVRATGRHLRDNAEEYVFLYELLSLGLPLLCVLQEVLSQMGSEPQVLSL